MLYGAFYNCSGLTDITIGANVNSISVKVFSGCENLKSVTFVSDNWYVSNTASHSSSTAIDVSDNEQNAVKLKNTYVNKYLFKS